MARFHTACFLFKKVTFICFIIFLISTIHADFTQKDEFGQQSTIPMVWDDIDSDGDPDLLVGNFNQDNQIFINNGDGTFLMQSNLGEGSATFAISSADFDNDGDPDIAVGNGYNQQNKLFLNMGNGVFQETDMFGEGRSIALAWADCDLDGDLDLAVGNGILGKAEQNSLYINNGNGTFSKKEEFGILKTGSIVWGDCDNDGDPDLAVGNGGFSEAQQNYIFINNGQGEFTVREEFGLGDTSCLAWCDYDIDGDLDLAVGNWGSDSQNLLCTNDGNGNFTCSSEFGMQDTNTFAWGDYNNDGYPDLAVGNGTFQDAEDNFLYVNNGDGTFSESMTLGAGSTDAVAWEDFDNDGDLDLAIGNEHSPTQNFLLINEATTGNFLKIQLSGHFHDLGTGFSNRDGIGAKVAIYKAGFAGKSSELIGYKEVSAHGGFSCQSSQQLHFGLRQLQNADILVTWSGSDGHHWTQLIQNVKAGSLTIIEEAAPKLGVLINMPVKAIPENRFQISGFIQNPGNLINHVPVFFILDIYGNLFFWPSWQEYDPIESSGIDYMYMDIHQGIKQIDVIHEMIWPETGTDIVNGLYIYGAMLNSSLTEILGSMDSVVWGYGPE